MCRPFLAEIGPAGLSHCLAANATCATIVGRAVAVVGLDCS